MTQQIETEMPNRDKWFTATVSDELSRLRRAIRLCDDMWSRRFLWVTLAETVRLTSNDRTSTYKLHARPQEQIDSRSLSPINVFADLVSRNADSFAFFRKKLSDAGALIEGGYRATTEIVLADNTGNVAEVESRAPFDLIMTSPPYGDNLTTVTYGQHSYLPLNWIDLPDIDEGVDPSLLKTTHEIDRRSLGGKSVASRADEERLLDISQSLRTFASALPPRPLDGKQRLLRFYHDFQASLTTMTEQLRPNGYMIWTVGNRSIGGKQVPTNAILSELMGSLGCHTVDTLTRQIHHKRMPGRNASSDTMREEKILLIRKLDQPHVG